MLCMYVSSEQPIVDWCPYLDGWAQNQVQVSDGGGCVCAGLGGDVTASLLLICGVYVR